MSNIPTEAEERLWEAYHKTRGDEIDVGAFDLFELAPRFVPLDKQPDPEKPRKRNAAITVSRDDLWEALTGKKRVHGWWNI